jgi:hypothetical protein
MGGERASRRTPVGGLWARLNRVLAYVVSGPDVDLAQYSTEAPAPQVALDIFRGDWTSALPPPLEACRAGSLPLFSDPRIAWAARQLGGIEGARVLELGPLEGGHSYLLERLGASSVVAVEGNTRAYLKCLIIKELLELRRVRFLHGDFVEYLRRFPGSFDLGVASGVLYHVENPVELIALLARTCERLFIWTHYYDRDPIERDPRLARRFKGSTTAEHEGFRSTVYRYEYRAARILTSFCGGSRSWSHWMGRADMLACCRHFGFDQITVGCEDPDNVNGPCFAIAARRSVSAAR